MSGPSARPLDARGIVSAALVAIASTASVLGFRSVFIDWGFLGAAIAGGLGATVVGTLAWRRRLLIGESLAAAVAGFVVLGVLVTGPGPSVDSARSFLDGLRFGWADLLSLTPPIEPTSELTVLPFSLAWAAATVGIELLRRTQAPVLPSLGPLLALSVSALITAEDRSVAITQGVLISTTALAIGAIQLLPRADDPGSDAGAGAAGAASQVEITGGGVLLETMSRRRRTRRLVAAAAVTTLVAVAAPVLGPRLPFVEADDRYDLRDRQVPPWDPLAVPSPLVALKGSLRDEQRDDVLFVVDSDDRPVRLRTAVLGDYDGVVWTVGSANGRDPASEFRPVSGRLPAPPDEIDGAASASATITIEGLSGPWLPTGGWTTSIDFGPDGEDGDAPAEDLRMNLATGTLALPSGVRPGLSYDLRFDVVPELDDRVLAELPVTPNPAASEVDVIPPPVRNLAADVLEGADQGWEQAAAVRDRFVADGFYDTSPLSRPGHSYFRLAEFLDDPERLVGFEEQYAAAAAVVARIAQLPARVVVGYVVPESRYDADGAAVVRAGDISAWVEIEVDTAGWVPIDVTPDRSREPAAEATGVTIEEVAVPSPPPPPDIPQNQDVFSGNTAEDEDEPEEEDEEDTTTTGEVSTAAVLGIAAGGVFALLLVAFATIALWKVRRRRLRRTDPDDAARVGFAWREVLDRYHEAGLPIRSRATPFEAARVISSTDGDPDTDALRGLTTVVQRAAYHSEPPASGDGDAAWNYHDRLVGALYDSRTRSQRIRMRCDPRTIGTSGWRRAATDRGRDR